MPLQTQSKEDCGPVQPVCTLADKHILLSGTYSSRNKGDAAMQLSMASQLGRALPGVNVEILAPFADRDRDFYAPLEVSQCDRRRLLRGSLGIRGGSSARLTAKADLLIDLSGDMLTEDYGPHVGWSHLLPLWRAWATGTPYFICAQSIGPFRLLTKPARFLMQRAAAVTARDAISRDYLNSIGLGPDKVEQTADMAFLLPAAAQAAGQALIAGAGLKPQDRILGVSVSRLVAERYDRAAGRKKGHFVGGLARQLTLFAQMNDYQLLFVPHVTGPSEAKDDRNISREVAGLVGSDVRCGVIAEDLRPEKLKAAIAECDLFVGARMHANIGALSSHVPTLAIAYSHKTPGIMAECGMGDHWLDIDRMDWCAFGAGLRTLYAKRSTLRQALPAFIARQRVLAMRNVEIVESILDRRSTERGGQ